MDKAWVICSFSTEICLVTLDETDVGKNTKWQRNSGRITVRNKDL